MNKIPVSLKRESLSSSDNVAEDEKVTDEPGINITSDQLDSWLSVNNKWCNSPDGADDSDMGLVILQDDELSTSVTSSNVHLDLLDPSSRGSSPNLIKEKKRDKQKVCL